MDKRHTVSAGIVQVRKPYYAFEAFGGLAALGSEVLSGIDDGNVYACAAAGDAGKAVLLSNYHDETCVPERVRVFFDGQPGLKLSVYKLDRTHDLEKTGEIGNGGTLTMGANCVVLLKTE